MASDKALRSSSLFDDLFDVNHAQYKPTDDDYHNLTIGAPSEDHLKAACQVATEATQCFLINGQEQAWKNMQYGSILGSGHFRETVAGFLTEMYDDEVLPKNVVQTGGSISNLVSITQTFFRAGDTMYIEDPTFFQTPYVLQSMEGIQVEAVGVDGEGIKIDVLERKLTTKNNADNDRLFKGMIYVIPTYNNPRGVCYSPERCKALIELARRHDLLIFSDDVYNMLGFGEQRKTPPRLLYYDDMSDSDYKGHVVSSGTFSKILAPGFRIGWFEASDRIVDAFMRRVLKTSGSNNFVDGMICAAIQHRLLHNHIDQLKKDYKCIVTWVSSLLEEKLPNGCTFFQPKGGYFIWIELPREYNASDFAKIAAEKYKLGVTVGERHECSLTKSYRNCIRISFAYLEEKSLRCAIEKLCCAITAYVKE